MPPTHEAHKAEFSFPGVCELTSNIQEDSDKFAQALTAFVSLNHVGVGEKDKPTSASDAEASRKFCKPPEFDTYFKILSGALHKEVRTWTLGLNSLDVESVANMYRNMRVLRARMSVYDRLNEKTQAMDVCYDTLTSGGRSVSVDELNTMVDRTMPMYETYGAVCRRLHPNQIPDWCRAIFKA
jgi:hypothetical protein